MLRYKLWKLTSRCTFFRESRTAILKQQAAAEQDALRQLMPTRSSSLPIAPRMDTLPPSFREKRERIISEAAQRATSLGSPSGPRDYPPNSRLLSCLDIDIAEYTNQRQRRTAPCRCPSARPAPPWAPRRPSPSAFLPPSRRPK
jgi:hypothetical protein